MEDGQDELPDHLLTPVLGAVRMTAPDAQVPDWSLKPDMPAAQVKATAEHFLRTNAIAQRSYGEVKSNWERHFPGVDAPSEDQYGYWKERAPTETMLDMTRAQAAKDIPDLQGQVVTPNDPNWQLENTRLAQSLPPVQWGMDWRYKQAMRRYESGNADGEDLGVIARVERQHQLRSADEQGFVGKIRGGALGGPFAIGEMWTGGKAAKALGGAMMLEALAGASGVGAAAARFGIGAAATGATFPSMGPKAVADIMADPRQAPKEAVEAIGKALVMHGVGQLQGLTAQLGGGPAMQLGASAAAFPAGNAAMEAVNHALGLETSWGTIGDLVSKDRRGEGIASMIVGALEGVAMVGLAHGPEKAKAIADAIPPAVDHGSKQGMSAQASADRVSRIMDFAKRPGGVKADMPIDQMKDGPLKDLGLLVQKTLPDAVALPDQGIVRATYADKPITLKMDPDGTVDVSFKHDPRSGKVGIAEQQPNAAAVGFGRKLFGLMKGLNEAKVAVKYQTLDAEGKFDTDKALSYASAMKRAGYEQIAEPAEGKPGDFHVWKPKAETPEAPTLKTGASEPRPEPVNASQPTQEAPGASNAKGMMDEAAASLRSERDPAALAKNSFTAGGTGKVTPHPYARLRDGSVVRLRNSGVGGEYFEPNGNMVDATVIDAWLGPDKKVLWERQKAGSAPTMSADEARGWLAFNGLKAPESDAVAIQKAEKLVAEAKAKGAVGVKRPTGEAPPEGPSIAESLAVRSQAGLEKAPTENLADSVEDAVGRMVEDMASGPYFAHEQSRIMSAWRTVRAAAAKSGGTFAEYSDPQWVEEHSPRDAGQVNRAIATIAGYHRTLNQRYGGWEPPEGWDPTAGTNGPRARGLAEEAGVQNRAPALPAAPPDPLAEAYRNKGITERDQDIHQRLINGESGEAIAQSHRMTRSRVNQIKDEVDAKVGAGLTVEDRQQEMALERAQAARAQGRVKNAAMSEQAQAEQAPVDESEPKRDIGVLSGLIKDEFDTGDRWRVDRLRRALSNFFDDAEIDAAFASHKMPKRGPAPKDPLLIIKAGAQAQVRGMAHDYYLKQHVADLLAPKETANVIRDAKREGRSGAEAQKLVAEAYEEALRFADRQVASETAAGEGHTGDPGDFNPAELESPKSTPDPARVAALMKLGYARWAAEERAALEAAKQQHPQQAMGAAALGELTHEAQAPEDPRLTALAHAQGDAEREALKLKPAPARGGYSQERVNAEAEAAIRADPQLPDKITAELEKKLRPLGAVETVVMERRKVLLNNELDRIRMLREAGDAIDQAEYRQQELDTLGKLERHMDLTDRAGSEAGGAFVLRQQLMAEDYSAVGMLRRATAAKGEPLTPEEQGQVQKVATKVAAATTAEQDAEAAFVSTGAKVPSPEFKDMQSAKVATKAAKGDFSEMVSGFKQKARTPGQKLSDWLIKARVNEVISGPTTLAKIVAASQERIAVAPLEETAGLLWSKLPGIAKIAAMAPRQGRGLAPAAEKRALAASFTDGIKDAWRTIRTGQSELDVLYGAPREARSWLDWQFSLHDAMKAPAVRNEYTRSFLKRLDFEAAHGRDVTSPAALERMGLEAYKDAQSAKFRQENWLVDAYNKAINSLRANPNKIASATGTFARLITPVVRVPTNLAFEVATHVFGAPMGAVEAVHARFVKGLENLKPAEADAIMRHFKKGSLGLAALAIGYANPQMFGGYYSGKRDEKDVKAGAARIGGVEVPSWLLHNPFLEVFQVGATARRAADKLVGGKRQGEAQGAVAAAAGLAEEIPLVREGTEIGHLMSHNARERGWFLGEMAKSFVVPRFVEWIAGNLDKKTPFSPAEEPKKRKPEGLIQHVQTGLPVLRESVPVPP